MPVRVRSFAKINLGLRIGRLREDGFHELRTVYQSIALHDVISVEIATGSGIEIRCADQRVPKDETNTCWRATEGVMAALGASGRVIIGIEKKLPVQGGLGAASSNAVATMLALERALGREQVARGLKPARREKERLNGAAAPPQSNLAAEPSGGLLLPEDRMRIAAEVGSDLPLFLLGGTVLGTGRGEEVWPLPDLPALPCVVATPEIGVSTPQAFAEWDSLQRARTRMASRARQTRGEGEARLHSDLTASEASSRINVFSRSVYAWLRGAFSGVPVQDGGNRAGTLLLDLVRAGIENDFEQVVFPQYPELCEVKSRVQREGARYASLSGSGSAIYGLFDSAEQAQGAAAALRASGMAASVSSTLTRDQYWQQLVIDDF